MLSYRVIHYDTSHTPVSSFYFPSHPPLSSNLLLQLPPFLSSDQPLSHVPGTSPPPPYDCLCLRFYRERTSATFFRRRLASNRADTRCYALPGSTRYHSSPDLHACVRNSPIGRGIRTRAIDHFEATRLNLKPTRGKYVAPVAGLHYIGDEVHSSKALVPCVPV